jgi:hypothetical protein
VVGLANELGLTLPPRPDGLAVGWGAQAVATLLPTVLSVRLTYSAVSLLLTAVIGLVVIGWIGLYSPQRTQRH